MNAVLSLYRSTIGMKVAMALSGLGYVGFVLFHMAGNMNFHLGPEAMNEYAHHLQDLPPLVWSGRIGLLVLLVVHVVSAFALIARNNKARTAYKGPRKTFATTAAAKSMRYGGLALLLFLLWHLADLTLGVVGAGYQLFNFYDLANVGFVRGEVYHNMLMAFGSPVGALFYIGATIFLSLHLYHGAWSAIQTLGFEAASTTRMWRNLAAFVAGVVLVGNLSFPISGLIGTATGLLEGHTITGHGEKYYGATPNLAKGTP